MKFAFSYCAAIFHTRSVFHSEAISLAKGKFNLKSDLSKQVAFSGCRTRIWTQTNRVRVCRATLTQSGNELLYYTEYFSKCQELFLKIPIFLFRHGGSIILSTKMRSSPILFIDSQGIIISLQSEKKDANFDVWIMSETIRPQAISTSTSFT